MFLSVRDLTVHVQIQGPPGAPVLLLLHSLGTSGAIWDAQAEALAASFRIVRPDLRGHGLTGVTTGPGTIEAFASDAIALLDALGIARAHLAGVSIGGMIAQAVAHEAPGRVLSLVLVDTGLAIPHPAYWLDRAAAVRRAGIEPLLEGIVARSVTPQALHGPAAQGLRAMLRRTAPEGYAAAAEAIAGADLSEASPTIKVPTLVLVGDGDQATDFGTACRLAEAIDGARLEVIEHAAHLPPVERPGAVLEAMRRFLEPHEQGSYEAGLAVRRAVLGDTHVDQALAATTPLDGPFQQFITRTAWGAVWARPRLDRRTRSLLTLAMLASLGHQEEFALHVRATRNTGATEADIAEVLMQVAIYGGIPAANAAMRTAKRVLAEAVAGESRP